ETIGLFCWSKPSRASVITSPVITGPFSAPVVLIAYSERKSFALFSGFTAHNNFKLPGIIDFTSGRASKAFTLAVSFKLAYPTTAPGANCCWPFWLKVEGDNTANRGLSARAAALGCAEESAFAESEDFWLAPNFANKLSSFLVLSAAVVATVESEATFAAGLSAFKVVANVLFTFSNKEYTCGF